MKHLKKKGQVMQNIGALGVGVAVLVIIMAVIFLVMAQLKTQTISQGPSTVIQNESITTWVSGTAETLSNTCMGVSCIVLYNDSAHTVILKPSNYTCAIISDTTAKITITNTTVWGSTLYLNYSCKTPSTAFNSTGTLQNATQTIPGWIPLIILVTIGGIILALVSAFKRR